MLTIEGDYPISIAPLAPDDPHSSALGYAAGNAQLLRVLNLLELSGHGVAAEKNDDTTGDWARIEAKLDVMLDMLGEWLRSQHRLPPVHRVWFSPDKLAVAVAEPLPRGQRVLVELYTSAQVPRPLRFVCTVDAAVEERERTVEHLVIEQESGAVNDELERYVFLLHRRQLSQQAPREAGPRQGSGTKPSRS